MTSLVRSVERNGLQVLSVATADLELGFVPQLGGRLVSVRSGGREFLWHNSDLLDETLHPVLAWPEGGAEQLGLGGTSTRPAGAGAAPGHWGGPPARMPEEDEFAYEVVEEPGVVEVVLSGSADADGLTVTRTFRIPARGRSFVQISEVRNSSESPVRWSVREVLRLDGASDETGSGMGDATVRTDAGEVAAKPGFGHTGGQVTFEHDGRTLTVSSEFPTSALPGSVAPEGDGGVALWVQEPGPVGDTADYLELDLLGPLTTLEPGGSTALHLHWSV